MRTREHSRREALRRRRDHGDREARSAAPIAPVAAPGPAAAPSAGGVRMRRLVVFESPLASSRDAQRVD